MDADKLIRHLDLTRHPEGGWYRESYRCHEQLADAALPDRYSGSRPFSTAIYFLLEQDDFSSFHRIKSDEIWHYYTGSPIIIYLITPAGALVTQLLGPGMETGQQFQVVLPAGCWFAAKPAEAGYSLIGCTVAPGFDFSDFELAERDSLLAEHPAHATVIQALTRKTVSHLA